MLRYITKATYLFAFVSLLMLSSCGAKKFVETIKETNLPPVEKEMLIDKLDSLSKQRPEFFYTKISTGYTDDNRNASFTASTTLRKDSAMMVIISYAKIPVYNAMITTDSLTLVDKQEKCYILAGLDFLEYNYGIDFTFQNIEEILLGLPVNWDLSNDYIQVYDPFNYRISYTASVGQTDKRLSKEMTVNYYLNEDLEALRKLTIESPSDTTSIVVNYEDRRNIDGFFIPHRIYLNITTPRNTIFVDLKYSKTEVNDSTRVLYVAIPENYEHCE